MLTIPGSTTNWYLAKVSKFHIFVNLNVIQMYFIHNAEVMMEK